MKITPHKYAWARPLTPRGYKPPGIVIHNAAATQCTVDQIHQWHLANGWAGFAYHAFVTKDGKVIRGRPVGTVGAHSLGAGDWLGICFEGNYDREQKMPAAQLLAGRWLVRRWRTKFDLPKSKVKRHKDMPMNQTSCPGKYFPMTKLVE